jgi:hypothetical protein
MSVPEHGLKILTGHSGAPFMLPADRLDPDDFPDCAYAREVIVLSNPKRG